jgi:hypothetical protein
MNKITKDMMLGDIVKRTPCQRMSCSGRAALHRLPCLAMRQRAGCLCSWHIAPDSVRCQGDERAIAKPIQERLDLAKNSLSFLCVQAISLISLSIHIAKDSPGLCKRSTFSREEEHDDVFISIRSSLPSSPILYLSYEPSSLTCSSFRCMIPLLSRFAAAQWVLAFIHVPLWQRHESCLVSTCTSHPWCGPLLLQYWLHENTSHSGDVGIGP